MLNRKHFTRENLAKHGLDIDKPYLLTKYVNMLRESCRDDHLILGLAECIKLFSTLKEPTISLEQTKNHFLFLPTHEKIDEASNGLPFYINKNFDWDWYEKDTIEQSKVYETAGEASRAINQNDEIDLLRYIARLLLKNNPDLPFEINSSLSMWNERFNK